MSSTFYWQQILVVNTSMTFHFYIDFGIITLGIANMEEWQKANWNNLEEETQHILSCGSLQYLLQFIHLELLLLCSH